jgi:hypothetical protein
LIAFVFEEDAEEFAASRIAIDDQGFFAVHSGVRYEG